MKAIENLAYIGLGSNLQDPYQQVKQASASLENLPNSAVQSVSSYYQSPALGPADQPDYINRVVAVKTTLTAEQLLDCLQAIEKAQGRVRSLHWGPRVIDLDILLFDNEIISTPRLTVPHAGLTQRAFFLYPLAEIAPHLVLPSGERIIDLRQNCRCILTRAIDGDESD
jgi:2-amino-4-hydroxy-6-hydroxymethyldihydropteridine diphosphokinase